MVAATLNAIRLLGQPRRYKHYATVPQCYKYIACIVYFVRNAWKPVS